MKNNIIQLLNKIEASLKNLNHPCLIYLNKGISIEVIRSSIFNLNLSFNDELITLFSWRNGTKDDINVNLEDLALFPGFYFMSLQESIRSYSELEQNPSWKKTWFPIFANGGGDFYAIDLDEQRQGQIIGFYIYEDEHLVEYNSLSSMLETFNECYKKGIIYIDDNGYLDMDYYEHARIANNLNPNLSIWFDMINNN